MVMPSAAMLTGTGESANQRATAFSSASVRDGQETQAHRVLRARVPERRLGRHRNAVGQWSVMDASTDRPSLTR
jgi:hypothetical protein